MNWQRWMSSLLLPVGLGAWLSGCSSGSDSAVSPPVGVIPIAYTALGASDAVGYNASISCDSTANRSGSQPQTSNPLDCPGGTGYVPLIARSLGQSSPVSLVDLGISGSVLSPSVQQLNSSIPSNLLTGQLPQLPPSTTLVTVWIGGNDVLALALASAQATLSGQDPNAFVTARINQFAADYSQLVQGIRIRAPQAKLVVANLPNFRRIPLGTQQLSSVQQLVERLSVGISQQVINPLAQQGIPVVDLLCDPRSYQAENYSPGPFADGFHPNDAGYRILSQKYLEQIQARSPVSPAASCAPFTPTAATQLQLDPAELRQMDL